MCSPSTTIAPSKKRPPEKTFPRRAKGTAFIDEGGDGTRPVYDDLEQLAQSPAALAEHVATQGLDFANRAGDRRHAFQLVAGRSELELRLGQPGGVHRAPHQLRR